MKKSELRKLIREVISEQMYGFQGACSPSENCVPPTPYTGLSQANSSYYDLRCPPGFILQNGLQVIPLYGSLNSMGTAVNPQPGMPNDPAGIRVSMCVPYIGDAGDMAGHGSADDPFVPGMGFEDQFIDQITGPGGPFGGPAKSGGSGKGKSIRESKKRHK